MTNAAAPPPPPAKQGLSKVWMIAFGVIVLVLLGAILFAVTRDGDEDPVATGTSSGAVTQSTAGSGSSGASPTQSSGAQPEATPSGGDRELDCSASALLAATPSDVLADGATVAAFSCSPASLGDYAGGFAYARLEAPGVDPLTVFYSAYAGEETEGGPAFGVWSVINYGTDVFCDEEMPSEACDYLSGAPRG